MTEAGTIASYLAARPYPGRGLVLNRSDDGAVTVSIFLTGRSHASQARTLVHAHGAFEVVPTDGVADDPLRHYHGMIARGMRLVAGNGRQVSDIAASGAGPATGEGEIRRQMYEPDPPIFTPRLSAIVDPDGAPQALLGIAFRGGSGDVKHRLEQISMLTPGDVWLMHTYDGNVNAPNAEGFIVQLRGDDTGTCGAQAIWNALHPQYRVAVGSVTTHPGINWADGEWVTQHRE